MIKKLAPIHVIHTAISAAFKPYLKISATTSSRFPLLIGIFTMPISNVLPSRG
jgi:hypothetical protein